MKKLTVQVTAFLFHGELGEKVNFGPAGDPIKISTKRIATPALTVAARVGSNSNAIVMSRAPEAVNHAEETARDTDFVYGRMELKGSEYLWKTNGVEVWTNYEPADPDNADKYDVRRAVLFPLVCKMEKEDAEMANYRDSVKAGTATADMAYRFSDAFYFSYAVNGSNKETNLYVGTPVDDLKPEDPVQPVMAAPVLGESILPWKSDALKSIQNDFSVESARKGKYRMNMSFGEVAEGNDRYDFRNDILPLSFLDGYVDNDTFRSVLRSVTETISSMFRANRIDETNQMPVNELIASAVITSIQRNILLVGDPATGKTMLLRAVSCALGLPVAIIRLNQHSEEDALTEQIRVTTNGFTSKKSKMYWYVKFGGLVVLDDSTNADTNILFGTLGGTLEAPYTLSVGSVDIPRHPLCFICATANIGTEGSRSVNEAFITRFGHTEKCDRLDDEDFKRCIVERARMETGIQLPKGTEKALVNWVFDAYSSTIAGVQQFSEDLAEKVVTLRSAISLMSRLMSNLYEGFPLDAKKEAIKCFANPLYAAGENECRDVIATALGSISDSTLSGLN